jgi:hypothetical protein
MFKPSLHPRSWHSDSDGNVALPKGECRYILLLPHVQGQRCACVGFSLNDSIPGSSCDCGHQACYHISQKADQSVEEEDIMLLKQKIQVLEDELNRETQGSVGNLVLRVSQMEEIIEKNRYEVDAKIKGVYQRMEGLWHSVGSLQRALQRYRRQYDDRIEALVDNSQAARDDLLRVQTRLGALDEASMALEDRVDILEENPALIADTPPSNTPSIPPSPRPVNIAPKETGIIKLQAHVSATQRDERSAAATTVTDHFDGIKDTSEAWTAHISLLPTASQGFPFERDTLAYKRCLSRGLHQTVVVSSRSSQSFVKAVTGTFARLLRGRPWMPLTTKICDAPNLRGLPMLKALPLAMVQEENYDHEFLKRNCATLDEAGNIAALYIARCDGDFAWDEIRSAPTFISGLEHCWGRDVLLDGPQENNETIQAEGTTAQGILNKKRSVGDLLPTWSAATSSTAKRRASELHRSTSLGSADGEDRRLKVRRQCAESSVRSVRCRAEAV